LLVELATGLSTTPATITTKATTPARSCCWICPQPSPGKQIRSHRIKHDTNRIHDQGDDAGPASLVELVELVELATSSSTAPATITGNDYDQGNSAGPDHDQGDDTGPASLVELVELATRSNTAPAKAPTATMAKVTAPAHLRSWIWWSWPPDRIRHRPRRRPRS
jgi:hypothetical protein